MTFTSLVTDNEQMDERITLETQEHNANLAWWRHINLAV